MTLKERCFIAELKHLRALLRGVMHLAEFFHGTTATLYVQDTAQEVNQGFASNRIIYWLLYVLSLGVLLRTSRQLQEDSDEHVVKAVECHTEHSVLPLPSPTAPVSKE